MQKQHIRHAQMSDKQAVVACVQDAYAHYPALIGVEPAPLHADYAALIGQGEVYVLIEEAEIQGVLVMKPEEHEMFVENIAVDPCFQGQGIGHTLMAFVEEQARTAHLCVIRLYSHELMADNLRFYEKLGFEEEDRRTHDGYRRVFLRKELA